ncbi:hypothetical protein A3H09_02615 [Candidatus Falkowbacteria bacterium RIFCSPLOWO2_12_FULL_45_13]|uniref:Uncharacterized protein n=2 Tax=Candidatus Falkowiibacteriota TaxID=1752728 RepID=A0A1F5SAE5_9BACT|nr:MAG: hypothetical protein A3H66_01550 [Candidatus Falkowbacteria bacterium RIFCSPLOWO2_02_FULL_45_21]OGF30330.1 MAG: hypothetical protein A3H09_02615 [Candidatus Falkowbacteria bacterium RIFCSPLOWO2_12_FULL_45_13]
MREPFLSETPQVFRKIPNRSAAVETLADKSGGAGRKGVEGEGNFRPALAFRKNFVANFDN